MKRNVSTGLKLSRVRSCFFLFILLASEFSSTRRNSSKPDRVADSVKKYLFWV